MTPSESDRTVTAGGGMAMLQGRLIGVRARSINPPGPPWGAQACGRSSGAGGSGLSRNARAMKPLALAGPFGAPNLDGDVTEGSKAPHSKCGVPLRVPWARIPPFPPQLHEKHELSGKLGRRPHLGKSQGIYSDPRCLNFLRPSNAHFACFADGLRSQPPIASSAIVLAIPTSV
jgi:hypothetical protein